MHQARSTAGAFTLTGRGAAGSARTLFRFISPA
jgi:hypothetical protein